MIKLDYSIQDPKERLKLVEKILEENPEPNEKYLEILADYLVLCMEKEEKRKKNILTENRLATVNKREISFDGLVAQLENGEDGIYNLANESKVMIFQPKVSITKKDLDEIPPLKQLREAINEWEGVLKRTEGREAYIIKKSLIEMRKDQYVIKNAYRQPIVLKNITRNISFSPSLNEDFSFDENGYVIPEGFSLCNPKVCSVILCNYSKLKEDAYGKFDSDLWYLMESFDEVSGRALQKYPLYEKIVELKIDGVKNIDIQNILIKEFDIKHSLEYISSLWRKKIPNLIASQAEDELLDNYYLNKAKGKYKKCSRCGQIKLAHNKYFSKNKTSKDGFYSICKECRNKKK